MTIQEQIEFLRKNVWSRGDEIADTMERLLAVYEAALKVQPLLRGDPLIDGPVLWQEDIDLRKAIAAVKDS
jgi:hypothetical protein